MSDIQRPLLQGEAVPSSPNPSNPHGHRRNNSSEYYASSHNNSSNTNSSNVDRIRRELHSRVVTNGNDSSTQADGPRTISAFQPYTPTSAVCNICNRQRTVYYAGEEHGGTSGGSMCGNVCGGNVCTQTMYTDPNGDRPEPNVITTGRYNLLTFFPQSLFEQFRRLANVYFLILGNNISLRLSRTDRIPFGIRHDCCYW
jgi:hypothetical protein